MSILREILNWSKTLPPWQSDAVSRLLTRQELSPADLDELFALLKADKGIPDSKGRNANPLKEDQIPTPPQGAATFELHAIKDLKQVNAIAENQRLDCQPTGLTIIYGDNGAGKSGYSRVLKRACRARDQVEAILPNANLEARQTPPAQASFEIAVNGTSRDVTWVDGTTPPPELSSLAVFDARCARAYLDQEDDYSYVPYGLDVFQNLAVVCQKLRSMVEEEKRQSEVDLSAFAPLQGETRVGKLIARLSGQMPVAQVDALATLSQEEIDEHQRLASSLREENPADKAKALRQRSTRFKTLSRRVSEKIAVVNAEAAAQIQKLSEANDEARQAAKLAAELFSEGQGLLPGSGGTAWRELFESARRFAVESHPDHEFPNLPPDSLCPLCQQPLGEGAGRLVHFQEFIQQDAERKFDASRQALDEATGAFAANTVALDLDEVTVAELEAIDAAQAVNLRQLEQHLQDRKQAIQSALTSGEWGKLPAEPASPADGLARIADALDGEAKALDGAADIAARAQMQQAHAELDARLKLQQVQGAVKKAIAGLAHIEKLDNCLGALRTNAISLKASELAEEVVSKQLEQALNAEFKALGVGALKVSLQSRSERGRALHKLKLELPQAHNPASILSEGEQRALAIGSFLAEVGLSGRQGGVIFDDPVSSLDHRRRERVARRLVAEATKRQVIVFTHDIYFLCLMVEEAGQAQVPIATQSLTRSAEGFGVADADLPFEGLRTGARVRALRVQQQHIDKLFRQGDEQEHRRQTVEAYSRLRLAWERAVEEVLFGEAVLRFRKGIETQRLAMVQVEDTDYEQINAGMSKCSNYAHDKAMMGGVAVPEPDELLADINALEAWRTTVDQRNQATRKRRK